MLRPLDKRGWENKTAWCGPSAVSALTGLPLLRSHERAAFITNTKLRDVEGMWPEDVILMLHEQGYVSRQVDLLSRYTTTPTLKRYMRERPFEERALPLLINLYKHFITAHMMWLCDNWTGKPVPLEHFPKLNRLVEAVWIVRPQP